MVGSVGVVWPGLVVLFFRCLVCKVWGRVGWQKQKPEESKRVEWGGPTGLSDRVARHCLWGRAH